MTDAQLKHAILFAGAVSWFLGKKALEGDEQPKPVSLPNMALLLLVLGAASRGKRRRQYYNASWFY